MAEVNELREEIMQAEHTALNNRSVQEFMRENFKNPDIRINTTVL